MKLTLFVIIAAQLLLAGCSSNTKEQEAETKTSPAAAAPKEGKVEVIVDLNKINGKTLAEVENVLGKAEGTEAVKGYPCAGADCQKATFKSGDYEIIFRSGKADRITINNVPDLTSNNNAIQALALPASAPSFMNANNVVRWNDTDNIHEISFFKDYILIQVSNPE
jgi:hypothetical protein